LADAGKDAIHWSHVGDPRAPDSLLASYALSNGLVVLTQDLDFDAVACSVVQIRAGDTSPDSIRQQVISALEQLANEIEVGALITVDVERSRVRLLPIRR